MRKADQGVRDRTVALYLSGLSLEAAGQSCGVSMSSVRNFLEEAGVSRRSSVFGTRDEQATAEAMIADLYRDGLSAPEIAKRIGRTYQTVCNVLVRLDVPRRGCRKYTVDHDYFSAMNTEEKWWVAGLIATDGCVLRQPAGFRIQLQQRDAAAVEAVARAVGSDAPILWQTVASKVAKCGWFHRVCLQVSSTMIAADLARLGITPAKTYTLRPPSVPRQFAAAWWRGCVDGDGHLSKSSGAPVIELTGTLAMAEGFAEYCRSVGGHAYVRPGHGRVFQVRVTGMRATKLVAKSLYGGNPIALPRKLALAEALIVRPDFRSHPRV